METKNRKQQIEIVECLMNKVSESRSNLFSESDKQTEGMQIDEAAMYHRDNFQDMESTLNECAKLLAIMYDELRQPKQMPKYSINRDEIHVATFNADPFAVDNDELLADVLDECGNIVKRYEAGMFDFDELAEKLGGKPKDFKYIYQSNMAIFGTLK